MEDLAKFIGLSVLLGLILLSMGLVGMAFAYFVLFLYSTSPYPWVVPVGVGSGMVIFSVAKELWKKRKEW